MYITWSNILNLVSGYSSLCLDSGYSSLCLDSGYSCLHPDSEYYVLILWTVLTSVKKVYCVSVTVQFMFIYCIVNV